MKRKDFLTLSAGSVGAVLLSRCANVRSLPQPKTASLAPATYVSQGGLLELDLDARAQAVSIDGQSANLLSYGGRIPGPQLEVRPGDTVRIHFTNHLAAPTNLHYHGLHIPPTGQADNPFLEISTGDRLTYEFTIPADHHSVTAYYHPHVHGYVAQQIFGGLGGVLIVRGALDEIPEIQSAQEELLFLKDFDLSQPVNSPDPYFGIQMPGREGALATVNGQVNPSFTIPSGGLLRFRIVNASTSRFYRLALEDHPLYLIATDGGAIAQPVELPELLLSPGERAEVLVRGNREPGQYRLLNLPYQRGAMGMMGGMMGNMMGQRESERDQQGDSSPHTLATLTYSGQGELLPLPQQLIAVEALPEPQNVRQFTLNHGMVAGRGMAFLINGRSFDHGHVDTQVTLDTVEEWELINTGVMDHPFHLHTNRFQIISRNNQPVPYPAWKDTILIPAGESARIRVAFKDFTGQTVYHCHILDHEDLGMMGVIEMQA
ncbi:MAG: multicopper oxidase family protein [Elainellaceae cyanobacterium]